MAERPVIVFAPLPERKPERPVLDLVPPRGERVTRPVIRFGVPEEPGSGAGQDSDSGVDLWSLPGVRRGA